MTKLLKYSRTYHCLLFLCLILPFFYTGCAHKTEATVESTKVDSVNIVVDTSAQVDKYSQTDKNLDSVKSMLMHSTNEGLKLHKLQKLYVAGEFDGDGKQDTIFEHNFSKLTNAEIEFAADPFQNEWDTVVNWFYKQDADLYLTMNKTKKDTLYLGITAQGLYCLINVGDNNDDGKDEIALVIDNLDYSRVNYCKIYTICNGKWTLVKQFAIHEDAFNFTTNKPTRFEKIKDFLEKKDGNWKFLDYDINVTSEKIEGAKMKPLKLEKCL